jgi:hypothetical protein
VNGFPAGVSVATFRLRSAALFGSYAAAIVFVAAAALLERRSAPELAVDHTLLGAVCGIAIPLLAYSAVARASNYGRLEDAAHALARHGANRKAVVLGVVVATGARVAVVAAGIAAMAVFVAGGRADRAAFGDAFTSAWVAALGGAAYVAWFALGSSFGRAGRGRTVCLATDWVLGSATSAIALPWPRAHLRSLMGGAPVFDLSGRENTAALYVLAAVYLLACASRVPR